MGTQLHQSFCRSALAASRGMSARALMGECRLCGWDCGVDRTGGPAGKCHSAAEARVFQERIEWAGETGLVPTRLLNFSGCNFRCAFCLTGRDSQDARRGAAFDAGSFDEGLHNDAGLFQTVTIEGGEASIFLPDALEAIARVPEEVPVVWKTNGYSSEVALAYLEGCVDVFLADFKFGNDACARRLAGIGDYLYHLERNLRWGREHSRLIVRHLVMPGHVECCFVPALAWLERELPDAELSVMNGFSAVWNSSRTPELLRGISPDERKRVAELLAATPLRRIAWEVADAPAGFLSATEPSDDHIYIGTDGSVRIPFMTAELRAALTSLETEIPMAVNFL